MTQLHTRKFLFAAILLATAAFTAQADEPGAATPVNSWQLTRLFTPGPAALAQEAQGTIVIYEGIRDVDVERAMDEQYDRLEYMMFVGTVITDREGKPVTDPQTGQAETEDDGC